MEKINFEEQKDYWFSLKPYIYVDFKKEQLLLYNTYNGFYMETREKKLISLITELYEPKNLGVTLLRGELYSQRHIKVFIDKLLNNEMGVLIEIKNGSQKPISLIPILNLQKDVDRLQKTENVHSYIGTNVSRYLLELNIYLNNVCSNNCDFCHDYCKQFQCCTESHISEELPISILSDILNQIRNTSICRINIMGGNLSLYSGFNRLYEHINDYAHIIHLYYHYKNITANKIISSCAIELLVNFPLDKEKLDLALSILNRELTTINFIVENMAQHEIIEKLIDEYHIDQYTIRPFYNGDNIQFFKDNVFMNKKDVFSRPLQMREIFRNQKLNSNFFGSLYILSDGTVKANFNTTILGNINKDQILDIIYREMLDNTAWRQIRNSDPCNKCTYQFICPAPSNYEKIIGFENLCLISNESIND